MTDIKLIDKLNKTQKDLFFVGNWPDKSGTVPIYHAISMHAFNRVIGYARFINASAGTLLYRGQTKLYYSLSPSGARGFGSAVDDTLLNSIREDDELTKFFNLDRKEIVGWQQYQTLMIESILQHYGARTFCMDFVDNHWCALWFGLYEFKYYRYHKRKTGEKLYVLLYVAETTGPCVQGMYIGTNTYTVDLRKALPSTFQRPSSQHGWIVRNKERKTEPLDSRVIGIIEVDVCDAEKWLGEGKLLSEENFFPCFTVDQGYKVLLTRQYRSGVESNRKKVLPQNTVCNYHYSKLYYFKGDVDFLTPDKSISFLADKEGQDVLNCIFSKLLNYGWSKTTCGKEELWDENNPSVGQSAPTALMIQEIFGGDIYSFDYSNRKHYYNSIDDTVVDMTYSELQNFINKEYFVTKACSQISNNGINKLKLKYKSQKEELLLNCSKK